MLRWVAAAGQPAYRFLFAQVPEGQTTAHHGADNQFLFHTEMGSDADKAVSESMGECTTANAQ